MNVKCQWSCATYACSSTLGRGDTYVGTDDTQSGISVNSHIDMVEDDLLLGVTEGDVVELEQRRRDLVGLGESEFDNVVLFGWLEVGEFLENC